MNIEQQVALLGEHAAALSRAALALAQAIRDYEAAVRSRHEEWARADDAHHGELSV